MQRPRGITITTWLVGVMNVLGFFLVQWQLPEGGVIFAVAIFVVFGSIVVWCYWKGLDWARWVVLVESLWSIWILKYLQRPDTTAVEVTMAIVESILAIFFLVYLNTKPVRSWFQETS